MTNNTTKLWTSAAFEVRLFDNAGGQLANALPAGEPFTFTVTYLVAGRTKRIQETSFGAIPSGATVSSLQVAFQRGTYPATYTFGMLRPKESSNPVFEDGVLKIAFLLSREMIEFSLTNKTGAPMRIDWNRVVFIDTGGKSQPIIHKGVRLSDREGPQAPTVISPSATIRDLVLPASNVVLSGGIWIQTPLFPEAPAAHDYVGRSFSLALPIEVGGKTNAYTFVFRVKQVKS